MKEKTEIRIEKHIAAAPAHVYRAFATAQGLQEWMADVAEADAGEGGRLYIWWNAGFYMSGLYKEAVENEKVSFSWFASGEPAPTEVSVSLAEEDGGTRVTLVHSGLGEGEAWKGVAENFEKEWASSLGNLKSVLETGVDKRQFDRPMLGFYVGGIVEEAMQKRLNLPVDYGMQVAGLLDGMGAERSGLLAEDVIAEVDGVEVRTFQSLGPVLARHKGGDVVKAVVYRGPERIDMDVELSKRPVPDFPPPPAELAALGKTVYKEVLADLKGAIKGLSEEEASRKPSEGEWSVKETLAHLLVAERWSQVAWDRHPEGYKFPAYPGTNRTVEAVAGTYKLKPLFKELTRSVAVQLAMIASLPEEYAGNKGAYFLAANNFEQGLRAHFQQHTDQVRAAIEAVRQAEHEA